MPTFKIISEIEERRDKMLPENICCVCSEVLCIAARAGLVINSAPFLEIDRYLHRTNLLQFLFCTKIAQKSYV